MNPLVISMPWSETFGAELATALPADSGTLTLHRFPDGESLVRLNTPVSGRHLILVCTLHQPDSRILPLLFAADTARELGACSVGLVAPYLAYMRQDRRFHDGEALTATQFASLLSRHFDWLVTVDPHLHRYHTLADIYSIPTAAVSAAPAVAQWIRQTVPRPLLVGPDAESAQWVATVAGLAGAPHLVMNKQRLGDYQVRISIPDVQRWRDYTPVLVDDIISSGRTMAETVSELQRQGLRSAVCIGTHAVLAGDAIALLRGAGAARVVSANTIAHDTNEISVVPMVATAVAGMLAAAETKPRTIPAASPA